MKRITTLLFFALYAFSAMGAITVPDKSELGVSRNYIINGGFERGLAGWATYNDGTTAVPIDGTGSSSAFFAISSTSPLSGTRSLRASYNNSNLQGQGISYDFTIDPTDQMTMMNVSFDYSLVSGTFTAGSISNGTITNSTIEVFIYDKDAAQLIQPTSYILTCGAVVGVRCTNPSVQFQTSATSTNYRLILHFANANSDNFVMAIDNVVLSRTLKQFGTPSTDFQTYTLTITGTTSNPSVGTTTLNSAKWRRIGDSMEILYQMKTTGGGAGGSGTYLFNLPPGYSIDTSKITADTGGVSIVGSAGNDSAPANGGRLGVAFVYDTTHLAIGTVQGTTNGLTVGSGFAPLGGAMAYTISARVPITGWGSNVQMSDTAGGRVVAARYTTTLPSGTLTNSTDTPLNFNAVVYDTHGAVTTAGNSSSVASGWKFTAPESGFYTVTSSFHVDGLGSNQGVVWVLKKNGTTAAVKYVKNGFSAATDIGVEGIATQFCSAGDTLQLFLNVGGGTVNVDTSGQINWIEINKIQGPATIGASESVTATYTGNATTSFGTSGVSQNVTYTTKLNDTHNGMNAGTGVYTVPVSGVYLACATVGFQDVTVSYRGRVSVSIGSQGRQMAAANQPANNQYSVTHCWQNYALAGQTISAQGICDYSGAGGSCTLNGIFDGFSSSIHISRVGN